MQLVTRLTKSQKVLRAFANITSPPIGFKGCPKQVEGIINGHTVNTYNLSRYVHGSAIVETMNERLLRRIPVEERVISYRVRRHLRRTEIETAIKNLHEFAGPEYHDMGAAIAEIVGNIKGIELTPKLMQEICSAYETILVNHVRNHYQLILNFCESATAQSSLDLVRMYNKQSYLFVMLATLAEKYLERFKVSMSAKARIAMYAVCGYFLYRYCVSIEKYFDGREDLGRVRFDEHEKLALAFIRKKLFSGLEEADVMEALAIAKDQITGKKRKSRIRRLIEINRRFASTKDFSFEGDHFTLEASPFSEKLIAMPISEVDICIYPRSPDTISAMDHIADYTFEHADGSIAMASLQVSGNACMVHEIQSDVPDLLRFAAGRKALTLERRALSSITEKWADIILEAVRIFAARHGFSEFYVLSPWRIIGRYDNGGMHPDKVTKIYFDTMQRLGGQLVYDDKAELDRVPQYYWRFVLEKSEALTKVA